MDVYKIYINTDNHVARGSLLSDTVITQMPIISFFADSHKTYRYSRSFHENSRHARLCSRLANSGNELRRKSRTFPTHCGARNDKVECYW